MSYTSTKVRHGADKPRAGRGNSEEGDCGKAKVPVKVDSGSGEHQKEKEKKRNSCCSSQSPQFDLSTQVRWFTAPEDPTPFSCLHGYVHT